MSIEIVNSKSSIHVNGLHDKGSNFIDTVASFWDVTYMYEPDSSFPNDLFALGGNRTVHRQVLYIDTSKSTFDIIHCISIYSD